MIILKLNFKYSTRIRDKTKLCLKHFTSDRVLQPLPHGTKIKLLTNEVTAWRKLIPHPLH